MDNYGVQFGLPAFPTKERVIRRLAMAYGNGVRSFVCKLGRFQVRSNIQARVVVGGLFG